MFTLNADVPAPRRACYGLRPGVPCPAYDDGTWPDGCDCMVNLRHYDGSLTTAGAVVGFIVFVLLFIAVWAIADAVFGAAHAADNYNPHCLTKEQARTKFPKQTIYWHTADRCWNDVAPGRAVNRIAKGPRQDTPLDALGNATARRSAPVTQERPSIFYPELMGGGGTSSDMLYPYVATEWQPITDFDREPMPFETWQRAMPLARQ